MQENTLPEASPAGSFSCQGNACSSVQTGTGNTGAPLNIPYNSFKNIGKNPITVSIKSPQCSSQPTSHRLNPGESFNQGSSICNVFTANY